jgi:hypothetical protein
MIDFYAYYSWEDVFNIGLNTSSVACRTRKEYRRKQGKLVVQKHIHKWRDFLLNFHWVLYQ